MPEGTTVALLAAAMISADPENAQPYGPHLKGGSRRDLQVSTRSRLSAGRYFRATEHQEGVLKLGLPTSGQSLRDP